MTSETLHHLYDYLVPLVTGAYREASRYSVQGIEKKELNDIATFTDRFMEQAIVEGIRQRFPEHTFIGEEYGENRGESPYEWLIDPIDGTVNFAAGIPMFGTTLALRKNKETIFGIIFDWPNNAIYYAATTGNRAIIEALMKKKINVKNLNNKGESAIFGAARGFRKNYNKLDTFQYLEQLGLSINQKNKDGLSPLFVLAEKNKDEKVISYFLEKGNDANQLDKEGNNPLMKSAISNNISVITALTIRLFSRPISTIVCANV